MTNQLSRLAALSPTGLGQLNAAVRQTCAATLGLPPLRSDTKPNADPAVLQFAEQFSADVAHTSAGVRSHFTDQQAIEITLDVMRNACNKIAVAFGADAPRVSEGTERYVVGADGQPVYSRCR